MSTSCPDRIFVYPGFLLTSVCMARMGGDQEEGVAV